MVVVASMNVVRVRECVADAGCVLFELVDGVRLLVPEDTGDLFQPRQGWQHFASNTVEELHLREALPALPPPQRALVRSQGGPLSSKTVRVLPDFATHQVLVPVFPCVTPPSSPLAPPLVFP